MVDAIIHAGDDRPVGPVALARKVHEQVMKIEDGESVLVSGELASVRIEQDSFGHMTNFELGFHQSVVNGEFRFSARVAERDPIGNAQAKASTLSNLNSDLGLLGKLIEEAYDTNPWEFVELEAASISGTGSLTDYEFKYETGALSTSFTDTDFEDALERVL